MNKNILIIIADQLSTKSLPFYGNKIAETPNIDRITQKGVSFSRAYTSCPLCRPARPSIWSGRFPHSTGILSNNSDQDVSDLPENILTMGEIFSKAGYETRHFGKRHAAGSLRGFKCESIKEDNIENEINCWPVNYDTKQDRYTTKKVVNFLESYNNTNQFMVIADLNNPHNICGWVGENKREHKDISVPVKLPPLPDNFQVENFEELPLPVKYICCTHTRLSQTQGWTETNFRYYLAAYYHYLSRLDGEVGLILDALERRNDSEETLIVFLADHGDGIASHRMVTKHVSFQEQITNIPLVFAGPGVEEGLCLESPFVLLWIFCLLSVIIVDLNSPNISGEKVCFPGLRKKEQALHIFM